MSRAGLRPPLDGAPLSTPVHLLLRDYPELLALLRRERIDPGEAGAADLATLSEGRPGLADAVVAATRWRRPSGTPRGSGEEGGVGAPVVITER